MLLIAAAWAIVTDCTASRISNRLTFGGAALALAVRVATGGPESVLAGAEGWLVGVALLIVPFALHWMGAGDVKLLALFGAIGGPSFVVTAAVLGSAMGGVVAAPVLGPRAQGRPAGVLPAAGHPACSGHAR
ncbi:MAG TPA: A24 family peptidase [Chloroflexota bacterium]